MAGSVTEAWSDDESSGGRSVTGVHGVQQENSKSVTKGMASSVHGLLSCNLGHGKLITNLLINPFVNGLRLVSENYIVNSKTVCSGNSLNRPSQVTRTESL